jgi:chromosome segregation ATPase
MDPELKAFLVENFDRIDRRFDRIDRRFDTLEKRVDTMEAAVRETQVRVDTMGAAIRETQVMVESQRSEIQLVAEGVSAVGERLDAFRAEVDARFGQVQASIALYYTDLDRRVRRLEDRAEREGQVAL